MITKRHRATRKYRQNNHREVQIHHKQLKTDGKLKLLINVDSGPSVDHK